MMSSLLEVQPAWCTMRTRKFMGIGDHSPRGMGLYVHWNGLLRTHGNSLSHDWKVVGEVQRIIFGRMGHSIYLDIWVRTHADFVGQYIDIGGTRTWTISRLAISLGDIALHIASPDVV